MTANHWPRVKALELFSRRKLTGDLITDSTSSSVAWWTVIRCFTQNKLRKYKFKLAIDNITIQPSGFMKNHENVFDSENL